MKRAQPLTSLILNKPTEMIRPKSLAILVLVERGWLLTDNGIQPPRRFATLRAAAYRNWPKIYMRHRNGVPMLGFVFSTSIAGNWRKLGCMERVAVIGCDLINAHVLTAKGRDVLQKISPTMRAAACVHARLLIWQAILRRRKDRKFHADLDRNVVPISARGKAGRPKRS